VTFVTLGASLALTAFLAVDLVASLLALWVWRIARRDLDMVRSDSRAAGLFLLRVLPAVAAVIFVVGIFLPAYCVFEPRESGEMAGPSLLVLAAVALIVIASGVCRGCEALRATTALVGTWMREARAVELPGLRLRAFAIPAEFPIVSVVGIIRPRLFISQRVLEACAPEELAAMVQHEAHHLVSRDNLKQLVLCACPDPLALAWAGREIEERWREASEEAADDYTVRTSAPSALALAAALLKVARLAPVGRAPLPILSALYRGEGVERRVRRLLGDSTSARRSPRWLFAARALAVVPLGLAAAVLIDPHLLRAVHQVIEVVVEILP
jgi:hypothetical protein